MMRSTRPLLSSSLGAAPSPSGTKNQLASSATTALRRQPPRRRSHSSSSSRSPFPPSALPPDALPSLTDLATHVSMLAYERVVLPCQNMGCGDAVYRSTLDPVLRMETRSVALPQLLALAGAVTAYLTVRPGVAAGAIDFYILDRASRALRRRVGPSDVEIGAKIAQGGFGSVYRATLLGEGQKESRSARSGNKASSSSSSSSSSTSRPIILKIAAEFGPAEAWMNERLARVAPWAVANFITAFDETTEDVNDDDDAGEQGGKKRKKPKRPRVKSAADGGPLWLLWEDEGEETATLSRLMNRRDWPYCAEPLLFGRELRLPKGARRRGAVVKEIARQLLCALDALHAVGIVHRDVKPQNVIISQQARRVKLIDLGAAADLRVGVNYSPNLSLLDPRFAPPEKYVMSRLTPEAPPPFLAAILSPVLWRLERPDRFDSYAVGLSLLQLCFPGLRSDDAIVAFQKKLASCGGDLDKWAEEVQARKLRDYAEGFEFLDADNGAGWELLCGLTARVQRSRPAAAEALRSRWLKRKGELPSLSAPSSARDETAGGGRSGSGGIAFPPSPSPLSPFTDAIAKASGAAAAALGESLDSAVLGERDDGGLTEAWLSDEFSEDSEGSTFFSNDDESDFDGENRRDSDDPPDSDFYGGGGKTLAWWRGRQAALRPLPKKKGRKGSSSSGGSKAKKRADAANAVAAAASSSSPSPPRGAAAMSPPESSEGILSNLRLPWTKKASGGGGK